MKTKLEILEEVANRYNKTNRGIGQKGCHYRTNDGRMCAVGACMTEEALDTYGDFGGNVYDLRVEAEAFQTLLKKEYRLHAISFWCSLQIFHDDHEAWDENGMTEHGLSRYEYLKNKYQ